MPVFASVAAYLVIDTFALLMWHQIFFARISRSSFCPPHLKRLIDYYIRQCQPAPLYRISGRYYCPQVFSVQDSFVLDTAQPF